MRAVCHQYRESDDYLRPHTEKNMRQHQAFLDAYTHTPDDHNDVIAWFMTLPLWLDLGGLRVVHACWDARLIARIEETRGGSQLLSEELLVQSNTGWRVNRRRWQGTLPAWITAWLNPAAG